MGAANTMLRLPNAFGAGISYIPEQAFGGSSSSLTPYYDKYIRASDSNAAPAGMPAAPLDTTAMNRAVVADPAAAGAPDMAFRGQPPVLQAAAPAAEPDEDTAPGSWGRFAAQDRTLFDPFNRGGGGGGILPAAPAYAAAPLPAGAPVAANAPDLRSIFMAQESSGGKTAPENPMQIQEATFNRYAQPGESYANAADKTAVASRMLGDYYQRYGGDLGRVATAYFSGEGNVAPSGSATPYITNTQDKNGKDAQSYVNDVLGRAGGAPAGSLAPGGMVTPAGLRDPYGTNQAAFNEQYARGASVVNPMMQWIQQAPNVFDRAGRVHAVAALMPAMGANNIGQVQGQGVDALNTTVGGLAQQQMVTGEKRDEFAQTPVTTGAAPNPLGPYYPNLPEYALPGGMVNGQAQPPRSVGAAAVRQEEGVPATVKVGATVKEADGVYGLPNGKKVTVKNGQIAAVQ
jgi:hypothetical protein